MNFEIACTDDDPTIPIPQGTLLSLREAEREEAEWLRLRRDAARREKVRRLRTRGAA